jgi:basic membrane lipoprotein Med (substrate-binding protein (PBP1-ABC) superfamily)
VKAHQPAQYNKSVLLAVRACIAGKANESQQQTAMDWIITQASNLYDMSYRDQADGGPTATAFHEGRRFVGSQIVKLTRPETLKALEAAETGRKPRTKREATQ